MSVDGALPTTVAAATTLSDLVPYMILLGAGFLVGAWGQAARVPVAVPGPVVLFPTATQELADAQSTASRLLVEAPATFGVGGTVHTADAAEGASSIAAAARKPTPDARSAITRRRYQRPPAETARAAR